MSETVTIPAREYRGLKTAERLLNCLESMGVDNWEGYDEAMANFNYGEDD